MGNAADAEHLGVVSFVVPGWAVDDIGQVLNDSFRIVSRTGLHCAPLMHGAIGSGTEGTVRLSVSGFTTDQEVDAAIAAVTRLTV